MGVLRSLLSFSIGAALGAAGGVSAARLISPGSANDTKQRFEAWKREITNAGEEARDRTRATLEQQFHARVNEPASK